jgi:cytochrome P450
VILSRSHPKASSYKWVNNWLGSGLLTATTLNGLWKRKRRMITPAFHMGILQRYVPVFCEHADLLIEKWMVEAKAQRQVDIVNDITTSALDIIGQCAFGYEFDALQQGKDKHPYVKAIYSCTDRIYDRAFRPWLYPEFTWTRSTIGKEYTNSVQVIHDFATSVISQRRALWKTEEGRQELENRKKLDFVDILLTSKDEDGNELSDQEIRDECNTFIFEGHDTTSAALSWTFYLISLHPEVEKKVLAEIEEVLGDKKHPDYEDMAKFKYLGLCIKEGLRLYPSVPTIARCMDEDTDVNGHIVPKGVSLFQSSVPAHVAFLRLMFMFIPM